MRPGDSDEPCRSPRSPDPTAHLPLPTTPLVPYSKNRLSHSYPVQPAVEVLNPLAQFFFPSSDEAKEVFRCHCLLRTRKKKAAGSRPQEGRLIPSKQEWGLAGLMAGPGRVGNAGPTLRLLH